MSCFQLNVGGSGTATPSTVAIPGAYKATDPGMLETGSAYLRTVGPFYGFFGLGLTLYFASQGAGRLIWPVSAQFFRLSIAAGGSAIAMSLGGGLHTVFAVIALALVVFGATVALSIAGGAWSAKR